MCYTGQWENLHIPTSETHRYATSTEHKPPRIYSIDQQQPSDTNHLYSPI